MRLTLSNGLQIITQCWWIKRYPHNNIGDLSERLFVSPPTHKHHLIFLQKAQRDRICLWLAAECLLFCRERSIFVSEYVFPVTLTRFKSRTNCFILKWKWLCVTFPSCSFSINYIFGSQQWKNGSCLSGKLQNESMKCCIFPARHLMIKSIYRLDLAFDF